MNIYAHIISYIMLAAMGISLICGPLLFGKSRGEYNYAWWVGQWIGFIALAPLYIAIILGAI